MADKPTDNVVRYRRRRTYDDALREQEKRIEREEQTKGRTDRSKT